MRLEFRAANNCEWIILVNAGRVIEQWPVTLENLKAFTTKPANWEWISYNPQYYGTPEKYGELISTKVENNIEFHNPEKYAECLKFYGL